MPSCILRLLFLFCLASAIYAHAQAPGRYQVYGGYSYLSNSLNGVPGSRHALSGFDIAAGFPPWHRLRFKLDISSYRGTNLGAPQHPYFFLGGGQYTWRMGRESLFVEGLAGTGGANKTWAANGAVGQSASFAALAGGGVDTRVTRRVAVRVEGGYQYSYFALIGPLNAPYAIAGLPTNFARVSTGLVWLF